VKEHGLQYLLAATVLTGVLQIVAGLLKLGTLMRFVSRSVITGFVNALAILIFMAQLPELTEVSWVVYAMTAAGLAIIYGLPYITRAVPSPLVTIVVQIRNSTQALSVPVTLAGNDKTLRAHGEIELRQSDFGITPFSVAMGALQVLDVVKVRFDLLASRIQSQDAID